jgi:hypothetical protein
MATKKEVATAAVTGFDFAAVAAVSEREDQGVEFHVHDHLGNPLYDDGEPVTMTVAGSYSNVYRDADRAFKRRRWKGSPTPEAIEAAREDAVLAPCVLEWSGFKDGGKPVPCSREYAVKALRTPWIRAQFDNAMWDHAGFFEGSSTTS